MKILMRSIGVLLLVSTAACRTSSKDATSDADGLDGEASSPGEASFSSLDNSPESPADPDSDGIEYVEPGYCHDGVVSRYLTQKFRKETPFTKSELKLMNKRRRYAGTIDTRALENARNTLAGKAAPYFGAIPVVVNSEVDFWIQYYKTTGRRQFMRWLVRGESFKHLLQPVLQDNGLPPEFFYLAMIESGFNNGASSHAKATGTWQFMKGTAKLYGLKIDHWVDERRDPIKSSVAAANYLRDLYRDLGDWNLAMAAYNAGPGRIRGSIRKVGSRDFWEIARTNALAKETRQYVPKVLAAILLASNPNLHGFDYQQSATQDMPTGMVNVTGPVRLDEVARELKISLSTLQTWNPEIIRNITPPRRDGYALRLPVHLIGQFAAIEDRLSTVEVTDVQMHKIRRGETLSKISRLYKVSVQQIMQINPGIRASALRPGRDLAIPIPGIVSTSTRKKDIKSML